MIRPKSGLEPSEKDEFGRREAAKDHGSRDSVIREANADVLLDIMEKFDMLIPYKAKSISSETRVQEYLVPCMMKRVSQGKVRPKVHNVPILFLQVCTS